MLILYRDFLHSGGVPTEILKFAEAVNKYDKVTVICEKLIDDVSRDLPFEVVTYNDKLELMILFLRRFRNSDSNMIVIGYFIFDNFLASISNVLSNNRILLWPIGQVTTLSMTKKVFTHSPIIKDGKIDSNASFKSRVLSFFASSYKIFFSCTFGKVLVKSSDDFLFFSDYEKSQFIKYHNISSSKGILIKWGIDEISKPSSSSKPLYYQDDCFNFIYWGRLDWHYKGIDRLLKGVVYANNNENNVRKKFKVFLCGPDYNNGLNKIKEYVDEQKIQDQVIYLSPTKYNTSTIDPLIWADCSVLLSRWDGFPRTLRESAFLNVPLLTSQETHFTEITNELKLGHVLINADDESIVADALVRITKEGERSLHTLNNVQKALSWDSVVKDFLTRLGEQ